MNPVRNAQPEPMRYILTAYGEQHICKILPDGWHESAYSWQFDVETFGHNVKYSTSGLRFMLEDADFIRKQLDKYAISTIIDLTVQKLNNRWVYEDVFHGQIDFAGNYVNDRDFFEVGVIEGGMKKALEQHKRTNFEIGFDEEAEEIFVPEGMRLFEQARYMLNEFPSLTPRRVTPGGSIWISSFRMGLTNDSFVKTANIIFNNQDYDRDIGENVPFLNTLSVSTDDLFTLQANVKATLIWDGSWKGFGQNIDLSKPITFFVEKIDINSVVTRYDLKTLPPNTLNDGDTIEIDYIFPVEVNNLTAEYFLRVEFGSFVDVFSTYLYLQGNITVSYMGRINTGAFSLQAYDIKKFGNKLLKKISETSTFEADILDTIAFDSKLFITTSDAIRGIPQALIKTNWSEFNKNIAALVDSGTIYSNVQNKYAMVEKTAIFDRNKKLLDLGEVKEMQIESVPEDWLYNVIQTGYEKQEYDYPLGRQDFACVLEFNNDMRIPNKKLDFVSKYRADFTGIHLIHYDFVNSPQKDNKNDNDVFLILAFKNQVTGRYEATLGYDTAVNPETMDGGGYFNILLSPHRNLKRHGDFLFSMLWKHSNILRYISSTETMSNMISEYRGDEVIEKSDLFISSDFFFKPIVFRFDAVSPVNIVELLGDSPCGYIQFTWNNLELKGFPIEIKGSTSGKSEQKFILVAHPDTPDDIQHKIFWKDPRKLYR